jgi:hypothetical protein
LHRKTSAIQCAGTHPSGVVWRPRPADIVCADWYLVVWHASCGCVVCSWSSLQQMRLHWLVTLHDTRTTVSGCYSSRNTSQLGGDELRLSRACVFHQLPLTCAA